jgi:hypothetical protein
MNQPVSIPPSHSCTYRSLSEAVSAICWLIDGCKPTIVPKVLFGARSKSSGQRTEVQHLHQAIIKGFGLLLVDFLSRHRTALSYTFE